MAEETEAKAVVDPNKRNRSFFVKKFADDLSFLIRALNKHSKDKSWNGLNIWHVFARWNDLKPRPNYLWLKAEIASTKKSG